MGVENWSLDSCRLEFLERMFPSRFRPPEAKQWAAQHAMTCIACRLGFAEACVSPSREPGIPPQIVCDARMDGLRKPGVRGHMIPAACEPSIKMGGHAANQLESDRSVPTATSAVIR